MKGMKNLNQLTNQGNKNMKACHHTNQLYSDVSYFFCVGANNHTDWFSLLLFAFLVFLQIAK
jgi:hypothetical protein